MTSMDDNVRMCRDPATWPARRLEKMGLCNREINLPVISWDSKRIT
jgi:hypothetical protein